MMELEKQPPFWEIQPDLDAMELYDPAYPIQLFMSELKGKYEQSVSIVDQLVRDVAHEAGMISEIGNSMQKHIRYVLDLSEGTIQAIERGELKLNEENGQLFAQFRQLNGHFGGKVPVRREVFSTGLNVMQISNAIQLHALEQQLRNMTEQIGMIDRNVKEVLQGQQNDRIGVYRGGLALFLEAKSVSDETLRCELIGQAVGQLSTSIFQLIEQLRSDICYLAKEEYKKEEDPLNALDQRMQRVHQTFAYIHQATMVKAAVYCYADNLGAMATVLDEYSCFIEAVIEPNVSLLVQCDVSDSGTEKGAWKSRVNSKPKTAEIVKQLNAKEKTLYLQILGEDD